MRLLQNAVNFHFFLFTFFCSNGIMFFNVSGVFLRDWRPFGTFATQMRLFPYPHLQASLRVYMLQAVFSPLLWYNVF